MTRILILNGPNLNLLGVREPEKYGHQTLEGIVNNCRVVAKKNACEIEHFQSNSESSLVERIHQARENVDGIIINPAAFTHTSVALRDALLAVAIPFVEVHLSNTYSRESFRHKSYFSDVASGVIVGLGDHGYELAVDAMAKIIIRNKAKQ